MDSSKMKHGFSIKQKNCKLCLQGYNFRIYVVLTEITFNHCHSYLGDRQNKKKHDKGITINYFLAVVVCFAAIS